MKVPKCFDAVKSFVIQLREVTAEETARHLQVSAGEVHQCFHILNLQGILSQAKRPFPLFKGEWRPDYYVNLKYPKAPEPEIRSYEDENFEEI